MGAEPLHGRVGLGLGDRTVAVGVELCEMLGDLGLHFGARMHLRGLGLQCRDGCNLGNGRSGSEQYRSADQKLFHSNASLRKVTFD